MVVMVAQLCEVTFCTWCYRTVYLKVVKMVNFMLHIFWHTQKLKRHPKIFSFLNLGSVIL